jgi:hypothetical protein
MRRRTSALAASAWSVLPVAMTSEPTTAPSIVRFAAKLPAQTPGQRLAPSVRSAASAMPEGAQSGLA